MADQAPSSRGFGSSKGKGKAVEQTSDIEMHDDDMDIDEEEEDDEEFEEEDEAEPAEEEEDDMAEIDLNNIVDSGRRTRGKQIDFAKAAEQTKDEPFPGAGEDEEDDEDYEAPKDDGGMEH